MRVEPNPNSAYCDCEKYIKENHLEYIADEIRKAYRRGWNFGWQQQPKLNLEDK